MAWSFGGVTILVEEDSGPEVEGRIDYVNPLTTTYYTVIRQAGRESPTRDITCVCKGNYNSLKAVANGAAHTLISDRGNQGQWVILSIDSEREQDKPTTPTVRVRLKLMKVES